VKYLFVLLLSVVLPASEMDRFESIVQDIQTLREEYTVCLKYLNVEKQFTNLNQVKEVSEYPNKFNQEVAKNKILLAKINKFEKQIKKLENISKTKDNSIYNLITKIEKLNKTKENTKNTLILVEKKEVVCVEENIFPQLVMKNTPRESEVHFAPATFRLLTNSSIFDSINGTEVTKWENKTSFTSHTGTKNWVKITGYFVEKKWQKSKESLWIKKENVVKR